MTYYLKQYIQSTYGTIHFLSWCCLQCEILIITLTFPSALECVRRPVVEVRVQTQLNFPGRKFGQCVSLWLVQRPQARVTAKCCAKSHWCENRLTIIKPRWQPFCFTVILNRSIYHRQNKGSCSSGGGVGHPLIRKSIIRFPGCMPKHHGAKY